MLAPTNFALRRMLVLAIIFGNNNTGTNTDVTFKGVADLPGGTRDRCLVTFYFATTNAVTGNATEVFLKAAVSSGAMATKFNELASLSGNLAVTISTQSSHAIATEAIASAAGLQQEAGVSNLPDYVYFGGFVATLALCCIIGAVTYRHCDSVSHSGVGMIMMETIDSRPGTSPTHRRSAAAPPVHDQFTVSENDAPPGGVYMKNGVWMDKDGNPMMA